MERVSQAVEHIEEAGDQGEIDHFLFIELFAHLFPDTVVLFGGVSGYVFGPQNDCLLTRIKQAGVEIIIRAYFNNLFVCNTCRLTKRRVMGKSITALINMAGLDHHHLFELGREHRASPFALDSCIERHQHFGNQR